MTKRRDEDVAATLGAFRLTLAKNGTVAAITAAPMAAWQDNAETGERGGSGAAR